ncbi:helix-turn-helix domain-containing protein [Candidatus Binatus sp.]|uniref:helix-turn-helix domain-containing protein n=1 Tax=Candidatus Binatus sp. TaxID=2811406 RepID=UPI0039C87194
MRPIKTKPEQLRRIRRKLGWTLQELAHQVGLARNSVARWERGEMAISEPATRLIQRIADDRKVKR